MITWPLSFPFLNFKTQLEKSISFNKNVASHSVQKTGKFKDSSGKPIETNTRKIKHYEPGEPRAVCCQHTKSAQKCIKYIKRQSEIMKQTSPTVINKDQ